MGVVAGIVVLFLLGGFARALLRSADQEDDGGCSCHDKPRTGKRKPQRRNIQNHPH